MGIERRRRTDGSRILLVEDSEEIRQFMLVALEGEGYDVTAACSAEEGLALMQDGRFDLVLSDYSLPGHTGAWLLREAVERCVLRGAATLIVTADPDVAEHDSTADVVAKPVILDDFLPQIRAILANGCGEAEPLIEGRAMEHTEPIELVLYISPNSLPCARATRVMRDLLQRYDGSRIHFRVCDMTLEPELAASDRIIFTPTLVKKTPPPHMWVLGDISRPEVVTDLLQMCGVSPLTSAR